MTTRKTTSEKIVVLLTDFGLKDPYVGLMKGVLSGANPKMKLIDLTHDVPSHGVKAGAFILRMSVDDFPEGTLFVCVVDPGVGSARKLLYAEAGKWKFLAPDNGLLTSVFEIYPPRKLMAVAPPQPLRKRTSSTFHGRDILAPLAGRLLNGESPDKFGKPLKSWMKFEIPRMQKTGSYWTGEVMWVDKFGNLITNLPAAEVRPLVKSGTPWFQVGTSSMTVRRWGKSFTDGEPLKPIALEGSFGTVEIVVREGSAAEILGAKIGDPVRLNFRL